MKKIIFLSFVLFMSIILIGCGKKKEEDDLTKLMQATGIVLNTGMEGKTGIVEDDFEIKEININKNVGKYLVYSKYLDKKYIKSGYNVIMNFHDPKNTTCNMFKNNIMKNTNKIPDNTVIIEVDINKYPELLKKYNVNKANIFIYLDKKGKEIDRRGLGITELKEVLD